MLCIDAKTFLNLGFAQHNFRKVYNVKVKLQTFYLEWVLRNGHVSNALSFYAKTVLSILLVKNMEIAVKMKVIEISKNEEVLFENIMT